MAEEKAGEEEKPASEAPPAEKPAETAEKKKQEKKAEKKGKRVRTGRKHESTKPYKFYEVKGEEVIRKKKSCPRCGPGTWLAEHKGRVYCGRCSYTEFEKK
jgi:small subunit ribosomal protein S27Ae